MGKSIIIYISLILVIIGTIAGVYFVTTADNLQEVLAKISSIGNKDSALNVDMNSLVELNVEEKPLITTINEVSILDDAQTGDVLFIYQENGKAILYRPSSEKIVDIVGINIENKILSKEDTKMLLDSVKEEQAKVNTTNVEEDIQEVVNPEDEETTEQLPEVTITILNGTRTPGMAGTVRDILQKQTNLPLNITALDLADANSNYEETVVVSLKLENEQDTEATNVLAQTLNISIGSALPEAETTPNTDLVIIVGEDYIKN